MMVGEAPVKLAVAAVAAARLEPLRCLERPSLRRSRLAPLAGGMGVEVHMGHSNEAGLLAGGVRRV